MMRHNMNSSPDAKRALMRVAWHVVIRVIAFLSIAGIGMGLMYNADNYRHMIAVGVFYVILLCAFILVATADDIEERIRKLLTIEPSSAIHH